MAEEPDFKQIAAAIAKLIGASVHADYYLALKLREQWLAGNEAGFREGTNAMLKIFEKGLRE